MSITWSSIRTQIRQRSDNEYTDGEFATDAELLVLANRSRKMLFGKLAEAGQHTVAETIYTVPVDGSLTYALPDDCFALAGVWRFDNGSPIRLGRHGQRTFPRDDVESVANTYRSFGALEDAVIEFNPRVDTGTYKIRYVAVPTDFALDADTMDGVLGWEEWIVLDCAIDLLNKEDMPSGKLQKRLDVMNQRIDAMASERDMLEQGAVSDVRSSKADTLFDDDGFLPGGQRGVRGYYGSF